MADNQVTGTQDASMDGTHDTEDGQPSSQWKGAASGSSRVLRMSTRTFYLVAISVWSMAVAWAVDRMRRFESRPGMVGATPACWPLESSIKPVAGRMTLVMIVHPQCSCTRAGLEELKVVLAQMHTRVSAWFSFVKPMSLEKRWEACETWSMAQKLPGVTVLSDDDGTEAQRLGALTSGDTVLYDAAAFLVFAGGITGARGHVGQNVGRELVTRLLQGGSVSHHDHAVLGCPLQDEHTPAPAL